MPSPAQILAHIPLFQGMDATSFNALLPHIHEKSYAKGEQIFAMGDKADGFFVILDGWVKLYRTSREGMEVIIHIFGPGETFAEAAVFNEHQSFPVNAEAVDAVRLVEIPRNYFVDRIEQNPAFALKILSAIAARQHFLVQQLEQVTARSAPQRVGAFLLRFCLACKNKASPTGSVVVHLPYDKSLISTRLNIQPETFSRALAKLKPYGVTTKGRAISIGNPQKLAEFCDIPSLCG